ncbi:transmembrane protein G1P-related 1, partial [Prunus dulcis]
MDGMNASSGPSFLYSTMSKFWKSKRRPIQKLKTEPFTSYNRLLYVVLNVILPKILIPTTAIALTLRNE